MKDNVHLQLRGFRAENFVVLELSTSCCASEGHGGKPRPMSNERRRESQRDTPLLASPGISGVVSELY